VKSTLAATQKTEEIAVVEPLRPRWGLFYVLMGAFVLWLVFLGVMFLTTVYPHPEVDPHRRVGSGPAAVGAKDR
jgi:hypothetical protein